MKLPDRRKTERGATVASPPARTVGGVFVIWICHLFPKDPISWQLFNCTQHAGWILIDKRLAFFLAERFFHS